MTNWVGAGLAGLIVFVSGDLGRDILDRAHPVVGALLLTSLTLSGGALAFARVNFEYAAARIKNRQDDGILTDGTAELPEDLKAPAKTEPMWLASIGLIFLAGALFVAATWWWFAAKIMQNC